jgi:hypothetical protein
MPIPPVSPLNDVTIQNDTTGQVDYLQFQGSTLIQSHLADYGLGAGWNIVGHHRLLNGNEGLVTQNATTGVVDFLGLDATGNLVSSALGGAVPRIIGEGYFGFEVAYVSQLANGELDFLGFNPSGTLIHSDLVANTIGLPHAVGVGGASSMNPDSRPFAQNGSPSPDENVILQLADGSLDAIGFSGGFPTNNLSMSNSLLFPGSAGIGAIGAINPDTGDVGHNTNFTAGTGTEGVQMVSQLASGQLDFLNFDSGYNDAANEGALYASNLLAPSFPGWHVVDGGAVATNLFPIS